MTVTGPLIGQQFEVVQVRSSWLWPRGAGKARSSHGLSVKQRGTGKQCSGLGWRSRLEMTSERSGGPRSLGRPSQKHLRQGSTAAAPRKQLARRRAESFPAVSAFKAWALSHFILYVLSVSLPAVVLEGPDL